MEIWHLTTGELLYNIPKLPQEIAYDDGVERSGSRLFPMVSMNENSEILFLGGAYLNTPIADIRKFRYPTNKWTNLGKLRNIGENGFIVYNISCL